MTHGDAGGGVTDLSLAASANITGGITNVNVQGTNSFAEVDCVIAEVSGLPTSIVTDQTTNVTASGFGTGSATNFTGPVTTTHALDTILGYMGGGAGTPSVGSGYTVVGSLVGTNYTVGLEFRNVASTATYNPGYTYSNPNFIVIDTTAVER
jgi:hypothetical protein